MTVVSLTEQIGAMSLVDDLRHQQLLVEELMDLPARRRVVAERLREFYRAQKQDVSDDVIAEGVRAYFDRRLVFEPANLNALAARLATLYVRRAKWLRAALLGSAVATTPVVCGFAATWWFHAHQIDGLRNEIQAIDSDFAVRRDRQSNLIERTSTIRHDNSALTTASLNLLNTAAQRIAQSESLLSAHHSWSGTIPDNVAGAQKYISGEHEIAQQTDSLQSEISALLQRSTDVEAARKTLAEITNTNRFRSAALQYPAVKIAGDVASDAINGADRVELRVVQSMIAQLSQLLSSVDQIGDLGNDLVTLQGQFADMGLPRVEQASVDVMFDRAREQITSLNAASAAGSIAEIKKLKAYAAKHVRLLIADRVGVKSGVERKFGPSGGKSWYLVVDAVDDAGQPINVSVTSTERGSVVETPLFAVRVLQAAYERVKSEKQRDGHVDDKLVGEKRINRLSFDYGDKVTDKPDFITAW